MREPGTTGVWLVQWRTSTVDRRPSRSGRPSSARRVFTAWYSGNLYDMHVAVDRALGYYAPLFWLMMACNVLIPQLLWFRRIRTQPLLLFVVALLVNVGMWVERFVIVVTSLRAGIVWG